MMLAPPLPNSTPNDEFGREGSDAVAAAQVLQHADLIVVAGVPGAGKSTALRVAARTTRWRILDPDVERAWFGRHLPKGTPYRLYRPLVHVLHHLVLLSVLLRGPARLRAAGRDRLLVHEPGTRTPRRVLLARLAAARGWRAALLLVEVSRTEALAGQHARHRVLKAGAFERHWRRWVRLRERGLPALRADVGWMSVALVARAEAPGVLDALDERAPETPSSR